MTGFALHFAQALAVMYPIGKRPLEPKLPPTWAPDATPGMDFRPGVPARERCARCDDWPEAVWYEDDAPAPRAQVCSCGFEQIQIHVINEHQPIGWDVR